MSQILHEASRQTALKARACRRTPDTRYAAPWAPPSKSPSPTSIHPSINHDKERCITAPAIIREAVGGSKKAGRRTRTTRGGRLCFCEMFCGETEFTRGIHGETKYVQIAKQDRCSKARQVSEWRSSQMLARSPRRRSVNAACKKAALQYSLEFTPSCVFLCCISHGRPCTFTCTVCACKSSCVHAATVGYI